MKTSVIEVPDMLSVLTVDEVEARYEAVPGVESATVNFEARKITVRYDETLLTVGDIGIFARQRGQTPAGEEHPAHDSGSTSDSPPAPIAPASAPPVPVSASAPESPPEKAEPAHAGMTMPTAPTPDSPAGEPTPDT